VTASLNGHVVTLPALPLPPVTLAGPVSPWPRDKPDDTVATPPAPPEIATPAAPRLSYLLLSRLTSLRWPDGDTVITWSMAATVAVVAVDAAIVSYSHIYGLATGHWDSGVETGVQARLLPLSIDGVIAEASLVKLYAARHTIAGRTRLATFMLWLGIVATVAANVAHGLPAQLLPPVARIVILALLSAWPAGAFIGSVEMLMGLVRSRRAVASAHDTEGDSHTAGGDTAGGTGGAGDTKPPPLRPRKATRWRRTPRATAATARGGRRPVPPKSPGPGTDPVADAIRAVPNWRDPATNVGTAAIAKATGVTPKTVQRRLAKMRAAGGKP
jgi:hypothetical protein